jgi:hypothetical protein
VRTFFLAVLLISFCDLRSQGKYIHLELGGSGGLGSINLEWKLRAFQTRDSYHEFDAQVIRDKSWITLRAGIGGSPIDKNNGVVLVFPVMVNFIAGLSPHKFEIGGGLAPSVTTKGSFYIKSPLMVGYRFEPNGKNFFFRASYTPIVGWWFDYQWQHWAGISFGIKLIDASSKRESKHKYENPT